MQSERVETAQAVTKKFWHSHRYQYIWKQELDGVSLQKIEEAESLDLDCLLEARVFSEDEELHIFTYEEEWRAVLTRADEKEEFTEETQLLRERYGKTITLRHYIDYEQDGQAYIAGSVLSRCETGEKDNG